MYIYWSGVMVGLALVYVDCWLIRDPLLKRIYARAEARHQEVLEAIRMFVPAALSGRPGAVAEVSALYERRMDAYRTEMAHSLRVIQAPPLRGLWPRPIA